MSLLAAVTLGYLYAVEAAAAGGVALFAFGVATHALSSKVLSKVLHEAMAITRKMMRSSRRWVNAAARSRGQAQENGLTTSRFETELPGKSSE